MRRAFVFVTVALLLWAGIVLALPFLVPANRVLLVPVSASRIIDLTRSADARLVAQQGRWLLVASDRPGLARRLYAAGAPLVLVARKPGGCVQPEAVSPPAGKAGA